MKKETLSPEQIKTLKAKIRASKNTIYCVLNRVSSSGMTRHISLFITHKGRIENITWYASRLLDYKINRDTGGLVVGGCGMDMGFHVVYSLGRALNPKGFKLPKGAYGRNGDTSGFDRDGGYAYNSQWL